MELSNWAPEHSDALREFIAKGLSFSEAAQAINSRFNTSYSRSAALGRARRLGVTPDDRRKPSMPVEPAQRAEPADLRDIAEPRVMGFGKPALPWPVPVFRAIKPVKLRCVAIEPRHLPLIELERALTVSRGATVPVSFLRPRQVNGALGGLCDLEVLDAGLAQITRADRVRATARRISI